MVNKPSTTKDKVVISSLNIRPAGNIVTTAEAGAEDLEEKVNKLERRLTKELDKQQSEQRNIIIGVLIAVVFIVATVAIQAIYFNAQYKDGLYEHIKQEQQDYKDLRDLLDQQQSDTNTQLLELRKDIPSKE